MDKLSDEMTVREAKFLLKKELMSSTDGLSEPGVAVVLHLANGQVAPDDYTLRQVRMSFSGN